MEKIHVIINPVSGNGRAEKIWRRLQTKLDRLNIPYVSFMTTHPGHASELALQCISDNAEVVMSVGGDGTAFEVAQNLLGTDIPLAVIPAGTGNDFIKSLNLPDDLEQIVQMVMNDEPLFVDVGRVNEKLFLNACGIGFDVSVLDNSLGAKKYFKGMFPYLWGVIQTILHYKPVKISLTIDGANILSREILVCSIANGVYIGGGMPISPASRINDGYLDVVVIENVTRMRMIKYLPGLLTGKILTFKDTTSYKGKEISITSPERIRLNVDGEVLPFDKVDLKIIPGGLKVFCRS